MRLKRFVQKILQFIFLAIIKDNMSNTYLRQYRRKGMIVSVTVLGLALLTVLLAYISFGSAADRSDSATVRYVAIVSSQVGRCKQNARQLMYIFFHDRFNDTVTVRQLVATQMILIKITNGVAVLVRFH